MDLFSTKPHNLEFGDVFVNEFTFTRSACSLTIRQVQTKAFIQVDDNEYDH